MGPRVPPGCVVGTFINGEEGPSKPFMILKTCTNAHLHNYLQVLPVRMNAHKHGDSGTRMRRFQGYPWKQNKNAYTNVWGKQIKAGCCPSALQIHGSSEKNEYSLVFPKHSYEAPAAPLCNKLNTTQSFSSAVAKVLFGVEQMLNRSKIRHDLPWRLCPQAHYEVIAHLSLCRHTSLCSHC